MRLQGSGGRRPPRPRGGLALRLALARQQDQQGIAIMMVLFLMFVAAALTTLVAGLLLSQAPQQRYTAKHVQAISSAESGLQDALTQVQEANDGTYSGTLLGDVSKLPCTVTGTIPGTNQTYDATVTYYPSVNDPTTYVESLSSSASQTWLSNTAYQIYCSPTSGLEGESGYWSSPDTPANYAPTYAVLSVVGGATTIPGKSATLGNRDVDLVYNFDLNSTNISGGEIEDFADGSPVSCFDGGNSPAVGTVVTLQPCGKGTTDLAQLWSYNPDLQLQLTETTINGGTGLCADDPLPNGTTSQANDDELVLNTCSTSSPISYTQQFSFNDNGQFEDSSSTTDSTGVLGSLCIESLGDQDVAGTAVVLTSCGSDTQQWQPNPAVGAGAAEGSNPASPASPSATSDVQLVNYQDFGRCLDVSNQNPTSVSEIAYPCKQDPNAADVAWNQKFYYNSTTLEFYTDDGGTDYCMSAPTGSGSTAYVSFSSVCPSGKTATPMNEQWTQRLDTGSIQTDYQYQDAYGFCLDVTTPNPTFLSTIPAIVVDPCTASYSEKWDAPPSLQSAQSHDEVENPSG